MTDHNTLLELTVRVVISVHDPLGLPLKDRIASVYAALAAAGGPAVPDAPPAPEPAVPVRQSIKPDYLVCLEDGKKFKMLKAHLAKSYGLTPDQYRTRWGLPATYPMVAPNYAARRRAIALDLGLGRLA